MTQAKSKHATVTAPESDQERQKIAVDDTNASVCYSSNCLISATSEEVILDFAHGMRRGTDGDLSLLVIDTKVFMSPWAAKRLALQLSQVIQNYEGAYGPLETDPRKRRT
jgi:Protein of unknown function (DUF3467)